MEVRSQLHATTALPSLKEPPVPTEQKTEWAPEPVWTFFGAGINPLSLPGITPFIIQPTAQSLH
jgi:hypothetical protein